MSLPQAAAPAVGVGNEASLQWSSDGEMGESMLIRMSGWKAQLPATLRLKGCYRFLDIS